MYATNVRELKKNPSVALRHAQDAPVLILKGDQPDALLIHLSQSLTDAMEGVRPAMAASLYRDGMVSLGRASKISGLPMTDFIAHLGSLGIDIVRYDETVQQETQDLGAWLLS